jgi:elongation factor P
MSLADHKFRAEEDVERATLDEREMQYLYNDGDTFYFMDTTNYEQIHITSEALGDSKNYLVPEATIKVEFYDIEPVGIELPPTVDLVVKETVPGIKGATASAQVKPATLETGLVVQVPPFVNEGDKVRINTETGEYQSRA